MRRYRGLVVLALVLGLAGAVWGMPPQGQGLLRLVDSAGRVVELPQPLERVAVLNPPAAEILLALGVPEAVVGISGTIARKPELSPYAHLPQLARSAHGEPDLELVMELSPQALITYGTHPAVDVEELAKALAPAAIPVVGIDAWRLETLHRDIFLLGLMFGRLERAAELIVFFHEAWEAALGAIPAGAEGPRVYAEHHGGRAFGPGSEWHRLITLAGGENIFADAPVPYFETDPELILERDPQVVLLDARGVELGYGVTDPAAAEVYIAEVTARPGWGLLSAVQERRVYLISPSIGSGPRKVFLLPFLVKIFYPGIELDPEGWLSRYHEEWLGVAHTGIFVWPEP